MNVEFQDGGLSVKAIAMKLFLISMFCVHWTLAHAQDVDVVGIRLGMNTEEVQNSLKAHGIDAKNIKVHRQKYRYSDGVKQFSTDDFVFYIDAFKQDGNSDSLSIFFSPNPKGGRVVAVTRTVENQTNPPTRRQYLEALKKKYGPPKSEDTSTVQWDFPGGKVQCLVGGVGAYRPTQPSILKKIYGANVGSRDGVLHNRKAKSLSDCASFLTYAMPSGNDSPATTVTAVMVDVAGTADGELSANEWVAGLEEQARKDREAKGAKPTI